LHVWAQEQLSAANALRATAPTAAHPDSSRSHALCSLRLASGGLLRLVDLAGSERHEVGVAHSKQRISEMRDINYSLSCLKECIAARRRGAVRVPYRRSKLTHLLKECLLPPPKPPPEPEDTEKEAGPEEQQQASEPEPEPASDSKEDGKKKDGGGSRLVFLSHLAPAARSVPYSRSTLDFTRALLQLASPTQRRTAGPERWSRARLQSWLKQVDGGAFAFAAEHFPIDGATMRHLPRTGEFGVDSRLRLAGLDEEAALTAAARLHELFGKELRGGGAQKPKKGGRKLRKEEGEGAAVGAYGRACPMEGAAVQGRLQHKPLAAASEEPKAKADGEMAEEKPQVQAGTEAQLEKENHCHANATGAA